MYIYHLDTMLIFTFAKMVYSIIVKSTMATLHGGSMTNRNMGTWSGCYPVAKPNPGLGLGPGVSIRKIEHRSTATCIYRMMQFPMLSWPHHRGYIIYDFVHCSRAWWRPVLHAHIPTKIMGRSYSRFRTDGISNGLEIAAGPS